MNKHTGNLLNATVCAALLAGFASTPAFAHHSFAMYDTTLVKVFTGVVVRIDPAPNHLQIFFAPMLEDRKNVMRDANNEPVSYAVEMGGSAQMAAQGLSVSSFPPGTVISMGMHPLRNGNPSGAMVGGLFRCPDRTPPAAGQHCDAVAGSIQIGKEPLAKAGAVETEKK